MAQQARDEAGNIWEVDAQGNAVRLIQPVASNPSVVSPNPWRLQQQQQTLARQAAADRRAEETSARLDRAEQRMTAAEAKPPAGYRWNADRTGMAAIPGGPADKPKVLSEGAAKALDEDIQTYDALKRAVGGFQDGYGGNYFGGLENTLQGALNVGTPGQRDWWADFQSTDNIIRNKLFGAALTPGEKAAYESTTITPSMSGEQIRKNLDRRLQIVRESMDRRIARLRSSGIAEDQIDASLGLHSQDFAPNKQVATGATRNEPDDKTSALIDTLVRRGASADEINAAITPLGFAPVTPEAVAGAQKHLKQYPGWKGSYGEASREVEQTPLNRFAGSDAGAAALGFINGGSAGFIDEVAGGLDSFVTGKPLDQAIAEADAAKQASAASSPMSSLAGNVVGGLASMATGAGIASKLGATAKLGKAAPWAGDIAFGGLTGAGESNENRLLGAGVGAVGAGVGRGLFEGATGMFGRSLRGVRNPDAKFLSDRGVRLTGGQTLGGRAQAFESKLTSLPFAGDQIANRYGDAISDMNRGVANDALSHIGVAVPADLPAGTPLHQFGEKAIDNAYRNANAGLTFLEDAPYQAAMFKTLSDANAGGLPEPDARRLEKVVSNIVTRRIGTQGGMGGEDLGKTLSEIRKMKKAAGPTEFGAALKDVEGNLLDAAMRSSAPDAIAAKQTADATYAKWKIFRDAANSTGSDPGEFTAKQLQAAVRKADGSADRNRFNQGKALLQNWSDAAVRTLPEKPNSWTADRIAAITAIPALGGLLGYGADGGVGGTGGGLAASVLAGTALNTPGGRRAVTNLLTKRTPGMERAGDYVAGQLRIPAGMFGRSFGVNSGTQLMGY